ncbi:PREDICTED: dimethyladenosine transferase 1, mitochondrial [Ceratosolen solmsi marchali]|uniref:rRNA adenine N(6)-methyltransferase n=1 Tax=Ceratosolen solmsi marchali TaxID=326594 RepID=A0AAJ6YDE2_9HYME|nr:PREDICTED: dimethyladenosine transferase 1, mitochondrial [Ceratosolen solmsi marchali]
MASIRLPPLPTISDIIKLYRLSAIKQLSQNFLMDERLTDKIIKYTGKIYDSQVLEVGPGPGTITRSIIKKFPKQLVVVEKDKRFKPNLDMLKDAVTTSNGNMKIIYNDIMDVDTKTVFNDAKKRNWEDETPNIFLVGNLPFNVSTALIIKYLHEISEKSGMWSNGRVQMTLTFQKEVAERLVAEVSQNQRCRLSVIAQAFTVPKLRFIIPGGAFVPKPQVDVGVVSFIPLKIPRTNHNFNFFEKINRHLFSFRQKHCIKCAGTLFPPDCRDHLSKVMFKLADVDPKTPAFNLTVEDINRLASAYKYLCIKHQKLITYDYRACRKILSKKLTKLVSVTNHMEDGKMF